MTTLENNYALLQSLEPRALWDVFSLLAGTPRESGHEAAVRGRLLELAELSGFSREIDATGNLLIRVPATPGFETAPTVVLQGHLDMVCTKRADSPHDFSKGPIRLVRDGDWLRADGTTLGADNGIGVAAALAAALDPSVEHGPLEILLTVDEEDGMTGALGLQPDWLTGKILLNLDSGDKNQHVVYCGCAGGAGVEARLPISWTNSVSDWAGRVLRVSGLRGGHSGVDIHEPRANAIKILTQALGLLTRVATYQIADISAGDRHNAIPREGQVVLSVMTAHLGEARTAIEQLRAKLAREFPDETALELTLEPTDNPQSVMTYPSASKLLRLLSELPHGVLAMSRDLPGLVETSTNLATVKVVDRRGQRKIVVQTAPRSSKEADLQALIKSLGTISRRAGATVKVRDPYPGWQPNLGSRLVMLYRDVYERTHGVPPTPLTIHAGLECGVFGKKYPEMDMCAFGPVIVGEHSPDERMSISSVAEFWRTLRALLPAIAQGEYTAK